MFSLRLYAVIVAAFGLTPLALASPAFDPAAQFATADANGDNVLTRSEFLAARAASFSQLDSNTDGEISKSEMTAAAPKGYRRMLAGRMFPAFDTNADGSVSESEFNAGPTPAFDRADADGNDRLEGGELPDPARSPSRKKPSSNIPSPPI